MQAIDGEVITHKIITFEKENAKQYIFSAGALSNKNIINALLLI